MEPTIVTQCTDIACNSHLRALRLGGNPHLCDAFVRALISAIAARSTNPNLETVALGHFPLEDQKLLKVLEITIDRAAHSTSCVASRSTHALVGGAVQPGSKTRRIDRGCHAAAAAAAASAAGSAASARPRESPRMSHRGSVTPAVDTAEGGWGRHRTPASAAVSPPQTAPRSKSRYGARAPPSADNSKGAEAACAEPASPWPLPPQALRPSPRTRAARRVKEVHLVNLSRLSPQTERDLAEAVALYLGR